MHADALRRVDETYGGCMASAMQNLLRRVDVLWRMDDLQRAGLGFCTQMHSGGWMTYSA